MSDDLDTRLTAIASEARASVLVGPAEIERALADITSGAVLQQTRMPETRRASATAWVAVAAAVVLVLAGGIWLTTRGDDQVAIVTPVSTMPTSAPAPTAVTIPEVVTSVPQPPPVSSLPVAVDPFAGFTREPTGIERVCGEAGCTRLVADLDGVVYSCDPATATVTRHADPSASLRLVACPFAIGPGAVAYSFESDDTGANFIVARSLLSGDELQRVPYEGDDADLVPTPAGLATVGLVLPSIPQPDLRNPPVVPWVLPDPSDAREFPVGVFEPGESPAISVGDRRWVVGEQLDPSVGAISGIVATDDGGFLAVAYSRQIDTAYLVRGRPDGSTAGIPIPIVDPSAAPALLERSGTIVLAADDTFVRVDPLEAFVPTTAPTAPAVPADAPPRSTAPTIDPFLSAIAVASTSNGVLLGQPDGSWAPAGFGALGKALLIDRWVVFQPNADPTTRDVPSIEIHGTAGSTDLDDLGPARLLDVGRVAGEPVALVSLLSDSGTGWNAESLQLVDLSDPAAPPLAVAGFDAVEGMRYAVNSAALGNDRSRAHRTTSAW